MVFKGKTSIRSKIVLDKQVLEQVSDFNWLGCDISFDYDKIIGNKIIKYRMICGRIRGTLR